MALTRVDCSCGHFLCRSNGVGQVEVKCKCGRTILIVDGRPEVVSDLKRAS